jgi:hemin uptake protein HemP
LNRSTKRPGDPNEALRSRQDAQADATAAPRRIPSEHLLGAVGLAVIVHHGREYRLRRTQSGKLILTA